MITCNALARNAFLTLLLTCPQVSAGQGFTAADVLKWTEDQQDSYFQTSVTMIGIVATQVEGREHIAECIDSWHGGGNQSQPARSAEIREGMEALPEHHPQAVILAVVQKECGAF
ncbi:MAG: hypothetical protein V2J51_07240 [Erythrobacter sp.]|jgi:hypothetical protein|nr:hypothetical protein [Erythrobacter sp.]